jgi:calcineurin-like phosphoesterase family protein
MKTETKKTWVCSDIHFNHANILQYETHRGASLDEMNELIINNHNSVVAPEDDVYIIGDVAMGQIALAPALIRRLNGVKMLVAGNHDKTLTKKFRAGDPEFSDLFVWVRDYYELKYKHTVTGEKHMIVMLHYPMRFWLGSGENVLHFHGHTHGSPTGIEGKILDVGIDANGMFPRLIEDAIDAVKNNPVNPHH